MWDLLENKNLFCTQRSASRYNAQAHLAAMATMLGPPPKELLERGEETSLSFDTNCKPTVLLALLQARPDIDYLPDLLLKENTMPEGGLALENTIASLDDNEKVAFSRFARKMLR